MTTIYIGSAAIDRSSSIDIFYTIIELNNPANETGKITIVEIWRNYGTQNVEVATFVGSNPYSTRDLEALGPVAPGSKQTFSGLDMDVATGDYIGIYSSGGGIEFDTGGGGYRYKLGDYIPCTNQNFSFAGGGPMSLYGEGSSTPSYTFDHWDINGSVITDNPYNLSMDSEKVVTPYFEHIATGKIKSSPVGGDSDVGSGVYVGGSITITATPK
jgi:hypothetical protein